MVYPVLLLTAPAFRDLLIEKEKVSAVSQSSGASLNETIDTSDWQTYRDEELGIEFRYPKSYSVKVLNELQDFDSGYRKDISVVGDDYREVITFSAASADYREGVGEGSPSYYASLPINNSLPLVDLDKTLKVFFTASSFPSVASIDGKRIFVFFKVQMYGSGLYQKAFLTDLQNQKYSNLLIVESQGKPLTSDAESAPQENRSQLISRFYALERDQDLESSPLFDKIISTIRWL